MSRCQDCGFVRQSVPGFCGCLCMGFGGSNEDAEAMEDAMAEARVWRAVNERVAREDRAAEVRLRGEPRVAELEKEANRG